MDPITLTIAIAAVSVGVPLVIGALATLIEFGIIGFAMFTAHKTRKATEASAKAQQEMVKMKKEGMKGKQSNSKLNEDFTNIAKIPSQLSPQDQSKSQQLQGSAPKYLMPDQYTGKGNQI